MEAVLPAMASAAASTTGRTPKKGSTLAASFMPEGWICLPVQLCQCWLSGASDTGRDRHLMLRGQCVELCLWLSGR